MDVAPLASFRCQPASPAPKGVKAIPPGDHRSAAGDRQGLRLGLLWTRPRFSKIPYAQVGMANQHPILSNPGLMEVSDARSVGEDTPGVSRA